MPVGNPFPSMDALEGWDSFRVPVKSVPLAFKCPGLPSNHFLQPPALARQPVFKPRVAALAGALENKPPAPLPLKRIPEPPGGYGLGPHLSQPLTTALNKNLQVWILRVVDLPQSRV